MDSRLGLLNDRSGLDLGYALLTSPAGLLIVMSGVVRATHAGTLRLRMVTMILSVAVLATVGAAFGVLNLRYRLDPTAFDLQGYGYGMAVVALGALLAFGGAWRYGRGHPSAAKHRP